MSLSLDDKLLGEKTHYYCSSSEDEGENEEDEGAKGGSEGTSKPPTFIPEPEIGTYTGTSTNTGPKGVIQDWRRYKQLEVEKREEQEREKVALMKKLSTQCRSHLDDEKEKDKDQRFMEQIEVELEEFEDEFLKEYRNKRIEEMRRAMESVPKFGKVFTLTKAEFVESIDRERANVTVIVHLFEDDVTACEAMNGSLTCLAREYPMVKFCRMKASDAKLSGNFSHKGVPALLIYKNKELIGNFIRLSDDLGDDFFASDVESFLVEHGMLPDRTLNGAIIKNPDIPDSDTDSDFDVD